MTLLIRQVSLLTLLLILAVPAWGQGEKGVGVVTVLTGKADLKRPQAPEAPLKLRDNLFVQDVVDTRKESLARILLMGKSSVTVRELSRLELREETRPDGARRVIIDLGEGKIRVMVARRLMRPGDEVQIRTPNAIAAVRGSDGIIEATTLPDGRPQTVVTGVSGEFEVTLPRTRPFTAMAGAVSDAGTGILFAQVPLPGVIAIRGSDRAQIDGLAGFQRWVQSVLSPAQLQLLKESYRGPLGGGRTGQLSDSAARRAEQLAARERTATGGQPGSLSPTQLAGVTIGQTLFVLTGLSVITPLTPIEEASGGGNGGLGSRICDSPPCGKGKGKGPPAPPPPFPKPIGPPCGTPPCKPSS